MQLIIFYLYLMLFACATKFDMMRNLKRFLIFEMNQTRTYLNALILKSIC